MTAFNGVSQLYGQREFDLIGSAHICIIGLGGVGSWAVESLARTGVSEITLVDMDEVCLSNINRQVQAIDSTFGRPKTAALKERILAINPECKVHEIFEFYTEKTSETILGQSFDGLIDAIDSSGPKCHLIHECKKKDIPIIVTGASGGKRDPTLIQVSDLNKSFNDNLLHKVRKNLRQDYDFDRGKNEWDISCVFSPEEVEVVSDAADGLPTCDNALGAVVHVTAVFGFHCANLILEKIIAAKG